MEKEKTKEDMPSKKLKTLEIVDSDYPYTPIKELKEGKFDFLGARTIENIKEILLLKLLLYSPFKIMSILEILKEGETEQKTTTIINKLKEKEVITKKINQSDFKANYLENLVYFGLLEASGSRRKRWYRIASDFDSRKYRIPPVLLSLIDEFCPIDHVWIAAENYNKRCGEVTYLSQEGEKSEGFDIFKIIYSLMSCNASSEESQKIIRKMDEDGIFTSEISKNDIVYRLIETAQDLGLHRIGEEMAKRATSFLDLVFIENNERKSFDTELVKKVIKNHLLDRHMTLPSKFSKELSRNVLSFVITDVAEKQTTEINRDEIIEGMYFILEDDLGFDIKNIKEGSKYILHSIKHILEDTRPRALPLYQLAKKISFYLLTKNGFVIPEERALGELVTDLSRPLPKYEASEHKKAKREIVKSIRQELKSFLPEIDLFVDSLKFSEKYNEDISGYEKELISRNWNILKEFANLMIQKENENI
jgi:hypothetical protein